MDTTELRSAYAAFLELARTGEFGAPAEGWDARHVVAHLAANDELLTTVTQDVLDGRGERYYNHDAIDTNRLGSLAGDRTLGELADWARSTSSRLCDLADTLPEDDNALVHMHIQDGDVTALDQPVPWHRALTIQARRHVPLHTAQLSALLTAGAPAAQ
jgi:hypothetical protein